MLTDICSKDLMSTVVRNVLRDVVHRWANIHGEPETIW
jgi:hypothetical protein